jgi:hypothetical protein
VSFNVRIIRCGDNVAAVNAEYGVGVSDSERKMLRSISVRFGDECDGIIATKSLSPHHSLLNMGYFFFGYTLPPFKKQFFEVCRTAGFGVAQTRILLYS